MNFNMHTFLTHCKGIVTGGGRDSSGTPANDAGFLKRSEGVGLGSLNPDTAISATAVAVDPTALNDGSANVIMIGDLNLTDYTPHSSGGATVTSTAATDLDTTAAALETFRDEQAVINDELEQNLDKLSIAVNQAIVDIVAMRAQMSLTADETNARVIKVEETIDSIGNIIWPVSRDYDENTDVLIIRVLASQLTSSTDNDVELDSQIYIKRAGVALSADKDITAPGTVLSTTEQWIEFDLTGLGLLRDDIVTFKLITNGANDTDGEEVLIHALEFAYRSCLVSYDDENDAEGNALR